MVKPIATVLKSLNDRQVLVKCDGGVLPEYVVVSYAHSAAKGRIDFLGNIVSDETLIFEANEDGNVLDWMDLQGSIRGVEDHVAALKNAGYVVVDSRSSVALSNQVLH